MPPPPPHTHSIPGFVLSKIVPFLYGPKPLLLTLGSDTPYRKISAAVQRDSLVLATLLGGLVLFLLLKFVVRVI